MTLGWRRSIALGALLLGIALLAVMLQRIDVRTVAQLSRLFGIGLPLALLPGAAWHLVRTEAWRRCFPVDQRIPFSTLFRVRLSAEAFSYVTIAGVTGEPLKIMLLSPSVSPVIAAAATALERAAYLVVTAAIVAVAAALAAALLPLAPTWTHIYAWTAAIATTMAVVPLMVVFRRRPHNVRSSSPNTTPRSRVRRFLRQFAQQFLILASTDRRRLILVVVLEAAAFMAMALEVFATLVLIGTPVTLAGAMAIETFTRVASFVAGFIPGNLGAMEMSNVAAVSAVYAAGGGIALALLRRCRGLAWCAAGFLIYPGGWRRTRRGTGDRGDAGEPGRTLIAIQHDDSDALLGEPLGGMPVGERLARAAVRAGYTRLLVWTPQHREAGWRSAVRRLGTRLELVATGDLSQWRALCAALDPDALVTVAAPGIVVSPQLLSTPGNPDTGSGVFRLPAREVAALDDLPLRLMDASRNQPSAETTGERPGALTLNVWSREDLVRAERRLRASIFKPTDGLFGRFNRRLSLPISIVLIRHARLSAHAMSLFVIALGLYAGWLVSRGTYETGVAAALISWSASVLDGCDGELARLQFKESTFGCWVDTLGDYVYYLALFAGLTIGAVRQTGLPAFWWCGAALGVGALLTFALLILLRWRITDGRPERLRTQATEHFYGTGKAWARLVAKLSMCATRATMPYGMVVFALLGLLPVFAVLASIGANVYWISLAREYRRLVNVRSTADVHLAQSPA